MDCSAKTIIPRYTHAIFETYAAILATVTLSRVATLRAHCKIKGPESKAANSIAWEQPAAAAATAISSCDTSLQLHLHGVGGPANSRSAIPTVSFTVRDRLVFGFAKVWFGINIFYMHCIPADLWKSGPLDERTYIWVYIHSFVHVFV